MTVLKPTIEFTLADADTKEVKETIKEPLKSLEEECV
jgi:uncharacterized protein (UPF0297 family)